MSDYFNFIESSNNHMDYVKKMREKLNMPKQKPKGEKRRMPVKTKEEADQLRFNTFAGNIDYLSNRGKITTAESKVKAPNDPSLTGGEQGFVGDFSVQRGPWKGGVEAFHYTPATFFPNRETGDFKHNIAGTGINPVPPEFKAKASFMDYGKNTEYFAKSGLPQLNEGLPSFEAGIKHWPGRKKEQQPKPYSEMRYGGKVSQYKEGGQTGQWPPPGFGPASLQMLQQMMPKIGYAVNKNKQYPQSKEPWTTKPSDEEIERYHKQKKTFDSPFEEQKPWLHDIYQIQKRDAIRKKEDIRGNPDFDLYTPKEYKTYIDDANKYMKELNEKCKKGGCEKPLMRYGGVVSKNDKKKKKGCGCKDKH